jgi:Mn2+/Fe2+ NRAMP family transporter
MMTKDEVRETLKEEAKEKAYTFIDFVIGAIFMALFVTIVVFGVRGFSKLFSKDE